MSHVAFLFLFPPPLPPFDPLFLGLPFSVWSLQFKPSSQHPHVPALVQDPSEVQEALQREAARHPFVRKLIMKRLSEIEQQVGPVNLAGVIFSV